MSNSDSRRSRLRFDEARQGNEDPVATSTSSQVARTRATLERFFGPPAERSFAVRFWDGSTEAPADRAPDFTLVLGHSGALRRALLPPTDARMGSAVVLGHIDIEGDIEAAAAVGQTVRNGTEGLFGLFGLCVHAARLPRGEDPGLREARDGNRRRHLRGRVHSTSRDADAVRSHYDVGNRFFESFLDSRMVYSCGYFRNGDETLDEAQEAKLDLICRKLRLREGDRLLDIGCGWGGLVVFAAERYGVHATGVTLSPSQAKLAQQRVAEAGLGERCRIEVVDYREFEPTRRFDKVASVGMVEHVGRAQLPTYFTNVARLLRPGGLFLNHGIVSLEPSRRGPRHVARRWLARRHSFIQRFVFPDSELVSPAEVTRPGELAGLELRDVENLREHYATTLRRWVRRLEAAEERAVREVGEATYRVWRLYMAASAHLFASGQIGIIQSLWGKLDGIGRVDVPTTREDVYNLSRDVLSHRRLAWPDLHREDRNH